MPVVAPPPCPHDLGPGTSVCLRCRQEQRELARARQRRLLTRSGIALSVVVVVAVLGNAALSAVRASRTTRSAQPPRLLASTSSTTGAPSTIPKSTSASTVQQQGTLVTAPVVAPATSAPAVPAAPAATKSALKLVVPTGRTELRDSIYVERDGDSAVVHFDTEAARTRRRDKFEAVVRTTLPALYGARAGSMLDILPDGAIVGEGDLLNDVAVHGVRLAIPGGGTLELWPVTRPGRDGPLVVGYRTRVTP